MKQHYFALSAAAIVAAAGLAQAQLSQSFDDITTLPALGWFSQNNSSPVGTIGYFQGNVAVFPPYLTAGYLGVNFNSTTGTNTISNWMLSPALVLENGKQWKFWTRTVSTTYPDRLQVRMSTNGFSTNVGTTSTSVGDVTNLLLDINATYGTAYPLVWTEYTVTISGLGGPVNGRIAFRYFVENGGPTGANSNYIGIDETTYNGTVVPPPTGGCCLPSGACVEGQTGLQCTSQGGVWQGANVACAGICPQPGACCLADGTCTNVLATGCAARTGVFRGAGTVCGTPVCPQPYTATPDVGETIATAAVITGSGPLPGIIGEFLNTEDVDMYGIQICDVANFRASTVTWTSGATGAMDSMLFLFRPNGLGVVMDDDQPGAGVESTLTNANIPGPGTYYLAISGWDRGPVGTAGNAGTRIWATQAPQNAVPNGPGAAMPLGGWMNFGVDPNTGNPAATGFYTIAFNGVCKTNTPTACYANCDSSTTQPCLNVLDFGCFLNAFAAGNSYANCDNSTTPPVLNVLDFGCFLNAFAAGCSSC